MVAVLYQAAANVLLRQVHQMGAIVVLPSIAHVLASYDKALKLLTSYLGPDHRSTKEVASKRELVMKQDEVRIARMVCSRLRDGLFCLSS